MSNDLAGGSNHKEGVPESQPARGAVASANRRGASNLDGANPLSSQDEVPSGK